MRERSGRRWLGTGVWLLVLGAAAFLGLGIYACVLLGLAPAGADPAAADPAGTSRPAAPGGYVGRILFRCDLAGSGGYCVAGAPGQATAALPDPAAYDQAQAREPFSPDGARLVLALPVGGRFALAVRDTRGASLDELGAPPRLVEQPAWSPGGSRIAYVVEEGGSASIWSYEPAGGQLAQLTRAQGWHDSHPSWSPDGKQIVFSSDRGGRRQLFTMTADGSGQRAVDTGGASGWEPVWAKPPLQRGASKVAAASRDALGMGLAVDASRCQAELSLGDDSGAAPITRVALAVDGQPALDVAGLQAPSYETTVDLGGPGTRVLVLQGWNRGAFAKAPKEERRTVECASPTSAPGPSPTPTPAPTATPTLIVVMPQATPADVLAAATLAAASTRRVRAHGTPTPTPFNLVTATFTPQPSFVTPTPTPANEATRDFQAAWATAAAFTTGTPTPLPDWVSVATDTATPPPLPTATALPGTPTPTDTPTPVWVPFAQVKAWLAPTATPVPAFSPQLAGKILFLSDYTGSAQPYAMNPDGSALVMLTGMAPYSYAADRDTYSADRTYQVFSQLDKDGSQLVQLYYLDHKYDVVRGLTQFGAGTAWEPVWSPADDLIAFVSNESGTDEIWVVRRGQWPAKQLTHSTWEWNHHPSWSPDGKQIIFMSNRTGRQQIWIMNADGSGQQPLTDGSFEAWDPVWVKYER